MYAVVRHNTYDPARLAQARSNLDEFDHLHLQQPGFRGHLAIQAGDGSTIVVNVWDSQADAQAGLQALGPAVQRLVEPLLAQESVLLAAGEVVANDLLSG
jgi:heme-degrading monooxygenase HmoA